MRVVLTTVNSAKVEIDNKAVASIQKGYLLLVGFTDGDNEETCDVMAKKICDLRVFPDENNLINLSLKEVNGKILSVSQFTLYADASKGRRPSFINALRPGQAEPLYDYFNKKLEEFSETSISTGVFGADMLVTSENNGPFTLILDSKDLIK